jgi:hypothetical protein
MTITYDDVRKWDDKPVDTAATDLHKRQYTLVGLQDELDDARRLPDWHGTAGEEARTSLGNTRDNAEILIAELAAVERALQNAADDVLALKSRVADNDALAGTYQFRVGGDGAIVDDKPADPPPRSRFEAEDRAEAARYREGIRQQLVRETRAILTAATNIDTTLARVMQLALDRQIGDNGATTLAGAAAEGDIDARVVDMEQSLREAGLLTGPPVTGHYRQWLENAVRRGVPIDTIKKIVTDQHVTPADFTILDGMEEIREDADGDYGAGGDFAPTPYGSEELQRVIDRQKRNSFSYDDDVGFVHGNGGRLVTTPNGMMMGLGGNLVQDQFSQRGGTTWGDTFMVNLDDPADPAQQLRDMVTSGKAWYESDGRPAHPGNLDLDRLLHHEERHSQQWAREGYTKYVTSYLWEQMTGGNQTEEDAGLSDGGY